jgi:adenosylcobinamide-phosphate synthase
MTVIAWSTCALITGFVLDALFGDPHNFPHIVRWIGRLIASLEKFIRKMFPETERGEEIGGVILVCIVTLLCAGIPFAALFYSYRASPPLGCALESFLCWQTLAARSLKTESMKVFYRLRDGDAEGARKSVSMIVGRDTSVLDISGIIRAAVETVAENASDGLTAPLLYNALGGPVLGCLYKAVNTTDSMVGYKNDKYIYFGRAAARTDDFFNYIPSRLCALLMIISAFILRYDGKSAFRVWRRDRRKHSSPNAAQTEAVCAGALGIRLAGSAVYFGKICDKPFIGDDTRPVRVSDIADANRLARAVSVLTLILALIFRSLWWVIYGNI